LGATLPFAAGNTLIEIVYELSLGVLILASAKTFAKGNLISIWLYGTSIVVDCFYHMIMGNPLNYLFIAFGVLLTWQIIQFRNELELV